MRILEHRALRGPNYYSRYLAIFMRLDIGGLEERPSDTVDGLADRMVELIPSLYEHRCSPGHPGGFLERIERGTWAGHIVEHLAIELQNLIGFSVGFGKTLGTWEPGVYNVVYRYRDEASGLAAGVEAVDMVQRLFDQREVDLPAVLSRLKEVRDANVLGPSTRSILEAAQDRGIPHLRLSDDTSYIQLGHGHLQERIQATVTWRTNLIGYGIADDKEWTKSLLDAAGIPVPWGRICHTFEEALEAAQELGFPVAVKPLVGNHGRGVTPGVEDEASLRDAFEVARLRHASVVVEEHLRGEDHRLLVIDGKLVAAARRRPAHVVGDGSSTLKELVDRENEDPRRGLGHENLLTRIELDAQTERLIAQQDCTLDTPVPEGKTVYLKSTGNLSTGGTATDVTDEVHPEVRYMAERIARVIGMDVIGIDLLCETLSRPVEEQSAGVVEVNAGPGFRMHLAPTQGEPRPVGRHVVEMLFPKGGDGRIPITAVTGTNGKTTTVRLISHLLRQAGRQVGMACTGSIEVDNHVILQGDYTGPEAARVVLREPTVEHAVLEVARGGIMRRGLGFDACDVAVLLNIDHDHLGEHDIHTLDEMARCKTVVVDTVREGGTSVLNADDPRVMEWREWAGGSHTYFTLDPESEVVKRHVEEHGTAFTVVDDRIVLRKDQVEAEIIPVGDVPITFDGQATFNVTNALAAAAAGYALGLTVADIHMGLQTFHPTLGQNPGRTNLIEVDGVKVLLDYGHNVPALEALEELVSGIPAGRRIGVGSAPGNRRDEDLRDLGAQLGRMLDTLFICETAPRGREPGETAGLLLTGVEGGGGGCHAQVVLAELDAVERALDEASPGDLLVLLVDDIEGVSERAKARKFR